MKTIGAKRFVIVLTGFCMATTATAGFLEIDFEGATFSNSALINNQYWPHITGVSHVYAAETEDGCEVNMVTATGDIKNDFVAPYDQLSAMEVSDLEWLSEECDGDYTLMEKTTDWYAQDDEMNIWYLGEETVAYDDELECLSEEGAWEAGGDAEAGIVILGTPIKGLAYQQEYLEDEAEDMGRVLNLDVTVELDFLETTYTDCMMTKEWTPLERGEIEHKYYCPTGGGLMLIQELHGKTVWVEYIGDTLPAGNFPTDLPSVPDCPEDD